MGWLNRLKDSHHYTSTMVKATMERDEATKKMAELRAVLARMEQSQPEWDLRVKEEPRLVPFRAAFKRTIASYKETYAAYEVAAQACQGVITSVEAACNNLDFAPVDAAWTKATSAVYSAKATAAQAIGVHNEFSQAVKGLAVSR